ncbi:MAG TPA: LacI family DNA-binding transcriptional regulator [Spirochaetales bacterium]|nr:LacI family DNA-binding transcriptional regulator [Spirochaetales bacterium]
MKVTLKDIAKEAGVSVTTASMALNGSGRLSEETRRNILSIARRKGYKPHLSTNARIRSESLVGILFSIDLDWAFVYQFVRPLIERLKVTLERAGYSTVIIPISKEDNVDDIEARIRKSGVIAIMSLHYGSSMLFERLEQHGISVIVIMNSNHQTEFYSVCADDYQGAYEGTRELIEHGHTKIAYFDCIRQDLPNLLIDRFFGFSKAIDEFNLEFPEELRIRVEPTDLIDIQSKVERAFARFPNLTGIVVLDDALASLIVVALRALGKRIPQDVSIIAAGDILDYSLPYVPQISTMSINTAYMGTIAAQMLLGRLTERPDGIHVLKVKEHFIDRGSIASV